MSELHSLLPKERQLYFAEAEAISGIPFSIIEKDFWVVWTLDRLFSINELKSHLTFKGGTSLSKVYGLIQRFSEDIDISIEKEFFGLNKETAPENSTSRKKQKASLDSLRLFCSEYVQNKMLSTLKEDFAKNLGTEEGWQILIDTKDSGGQTLIFEYPNITPRGSYIQQSLKIEIGARSEHWPVSNKMIRSYAKEMLKEKITEPEVMVRVLNVERTFWEKATILHQYAHIPADKTLPPRLSRHFYDFFCLLNSKVKGEALAKIDLLEKVAAHKKIYFASTWAHYESAKKGSLKLYPHERNLNLLKSDYQQMEQMFFGDSPPKWDLILKTIRDFEAEFNSPN